MNTNIYFLGIKDLNESTLLTILKNLDISKVINVSKNINNNLRDQIITNAYMYSDLQERVPNWEPIKSKLLSSLFSEEEIDNYTVHTSFNEFIFEVLTFNLEVEISNNSNVAIFVENNEFTDPVRIHFSYLCQNNILDNFDVNHIYNNGYSFNLISNNFKIEKNYYLYVLKDLEPLKGAISTELLFKSELVKICKPETTLIKSYNQSEALKNFIIPYYPTKKYQGHEYDIKRKKIFDIKKNRPGSSDFVYEDFRKKIEELNIKFDYVTRVLGSKETKCEGNKLLDIVIHRFTKDYRVKDASNLFYKTGIGNELKYVRGDSRKQEVLKYLKLNSKDFSLDNSSIMIFDDVRTTGSSLEAYAQLINENFKNVTVFALCYAQSQ